MIVAVSRLNKYGAVRQTLERRPRQNLLLLLLGGLVKPSIMMEWLRAW